MIKAIVFDFDGLILDTEYAEFASWQELYGEESLEMRLEDWTSIIGRGASTVEWSPYDDLAKKLGDRFDLSAIRERRRVIFDRYIKDEQVMPGVRELIDAARQAALMLAVASSSPSNWVEGFLAQLGLRAFFDIVRTADDVALAKPEPDLYLAALDSLGVRAQEALALEDSANGISAAKAAGLYCVAVPNRLTRHTSLGHADLIVRSLADVTLSGLVELADAHYRARG